ncbi:hypothetical protein B0H19DRAFT_1098982 [Mycena capillaripes]|nr:hypothetical protein B0H19DRAFT_1098982 [Mycena capillaripes]
MGDPLVDDSWLVEKGVTMSILQNPLRTRIHLTGKVAWHVPAHWHAVHDENHIVLKGKVIVTQDGVKKVIRPEDGPSLTRRGVVHSIDVPAGEEVILEETTLQSVEVTEQKTLFFRNLSFALGTNQSFLGVMQVFYYGDAYPKLLPTGRWFERVFVVVTGGWLAPLLGHQLADKRLRMDPNRFPVKETD